MKRICDFTLALPFIKTIVLFMLLISLISCGKYGGTTVVNPINYIDVNPNTSQSDDQSISNENSKNNAFDKDKEKPAPQKNNDPGLIEPT